MGLEIHRGHLESQWSKGHFHQKCYFSFRLHGMVMGLMYIHHLDTLYRSNESKNSAGVILGQKVILIKNAITRLRYIA